MREPTPDDIVDELFAKAYKPHRRNHMVKRISIAVVYLFLLGPPIFLIGALAEAIWSDRVTVMGETRTERHERIYGHTDLSDWRRCE